jgi:hypothetical protein
MRRLAKVNDLEKPQSGFYLFVFGGVAGAIPRRRGERKTGASRAVAWGKAFPLFIFQSKKIFLETEDWFGKNDIISKLLKHTSMRKNLCQLIHNTKRRNKIDEQESDVISKLNYCVLYNVKRFF